MLRVAVAVLRPYMDALLSYNGLRLVVADNKLPPIGHDRFQRFAFPDGIGVQLVVPL